MRIALLIFVTILPMWLGGASLQAQTVANPPKIVNRDGRFALMVDDRPFFILGTQIHNSSSWPKMMPKVWTLAEELHTNTIEAPIYWEHFERSPANFDYSTVDMLVHQAREHHMRLVLLWFGTWKNARMHYVPQWIKSDPAKYPLMTKRDGDSLDVLSPYSLNTLHADEAAFAALMRHLKAIDSTEQTVIMVQVENESGSLGTVRDHSPKANKLFSGPVPQQLLTALHKPSGTWRQVFDKDADEFFAAYGVASFINQVAASGKAEYALPMYCNTWLRDPLKETYPGKSYPSGGPTYNVINVWKAAAPNIDLIVPDIYFGSRTAWKKILQEYGRADNPLFIPETLGMSDVNDLSDVSSYLFYAIGANAIGFSPFGIDSLPLNAFARNAYPKLENDAATFAVFRSMDRVLAELIYDGQVKTAVQERQRNRVALDFGRWTAIVSFLHDPIDPNAASSSVHRQDGRVLVAPLGHDQFLVVGFDAHVDFVLTHPAMHQHPRYLRVEEGTYQGTSWKSDRWLNGDETDAGLDFGADGSILHVNVGSY